MFFKAISCCVIGFGVKDSDPDSIKMVLERFGLEDSYSDSEKVF